MKRISILITFVVLMAFVIAACQPAATPTTEGTGGEASMEDTGVVYIMGAFRGEEETAFTSVIEAFEAENPDIDVVYSGSSEFETLINVRVDAGDPPDVAAIPQPGLMNAFAADGELVELWPEVLELYDQNYQPAWVELGSYEGTPYGVFHRVNAKGWIWYNKPAWQEAGWPTPENWEGVMELSQQMIDETDLAPWCIGIESGAATGWVGTDWLENFMLRTQPVSVYDNWISHDLLFSSDEVVNAWQIMDEVWMGEGMVYGGAQTIATTNFQDAAAWIFEGPNCWMHMQGSFVTNFFPEDVQADLDNQVGVFIMPPIDESLPNTLEVGGDQYVVFQGHDRPEVKRFVEFLATGASANPWIELGGALFPHQDQDLSLYPTEIERTMAEAILTAEAARFDASDAMVSAVNVAFWEGITDYVAGTPIEEVVQNIDEAIP